MRNGVRRQRRIRAVTALALVLGATLGFASSALAAPKWGVTVKPLNPYGQLGEENPFLEAKFPLEPEKAESAFQRLSGYNEYKIIVTNTAAAAGGANAVAEGAQVVVKDVLPPGLAIEGPPSQVAGGLYWSCKTTPLSNGGEERPRSVSCKPDSPALAEGAHYEPLEIFAYVESGAAGSLNDEVEVSGGGAAAPASASATTTIAEAVPFGLQKKTGGLKQSFGVADLAEEGARNSRTELEGSTLKPETQAGGHPVSFSTEVEYNTTTELQGKLTSAGGSNFGFAVGPKELEVELPPGFIGNPQSAEFCPIAELEASAKQDDCPAGAAVGYIAFTYTAQTLEPGRKGIAVAERALIENVEPPPGHPAEFGLISKEGFVGLFYAKVRTEGDYGVTAGLESSPPIKVANVVFCGYGVNAPYVNEVLEPSCKTRSSAVKPFLTNPTRCEGLNEVVLRTSPWAEPSDVITAPASLGTFVDCHPATYQNDTEHPTLRFTPPGEKSQSEQYGEKEAVAGPDSPSPIDLNLTLPQSGSPAGIATPDLKNLELTLASGLTLNPAAAEGLGVCTDAEFALHVSKPASSECLKAQIGTVEIYTPLLPTATGKAEHTPGEAGQLKGQLFVGEPKCGGPCTAEDAADGKLFRLLLQVQDPKAGLVVKLEGKADVNQDTHQLETVFENQPQLPFEEVQVKLKSGPRAPIATPQVCGTVTSTASLKPWSAPEAEAFNVASRTFQVSCSGGGFSPKLDAGTGYPAAGQFSDFDLTLSRNDGEGDLSQVTVHTPPGLTAKIANVPVCEEPQASEGNCSEASQIGTFTALAGAGPNPLVVPEGKVYLTGPYDGSEAPGQGGCTRYAPGCAPYGLAFVIEAKAGPFDLGRTRTLSGTVPRAKIEIDENTAAVTVTANPLPQTIDGVELRVRKINVHIDRPDFFLNPTDCEPATISSSISSAAAPAQQATPTAKFDVGGCRGLAFKPSLTAYTKSNTSKETGAALFVKVTQRPGEANIHKVEVQLPRALPARLTTLHHACTIQQFDKNRWACPKESFVGGGEARTPLLNVPLTGPAVLVSHAGASFPDVVFLLHADGIEIALDGHTQIKDGITYSKFETVPDQPITSFEAKLPIGQHSVLAANGYLCTQTLTMPTTIVSQNGAEITQQTHVSTKGCPVTRAEKLPKELAACRARDRHNTLKLLTCEAAANRKDGPQSKTARASAAIAAGVSGAATAGAPSVASAVAGSARATAPAGSSAAAVGAEGCSPATEVARQELTHGVAYSKELPECRVFELVSPLEKSGRSIASLEAVSPSGESVGFQAEGAFAGVEGFDLEGKIAKNYYVATRVGSGTGAEWQTRGTVAPPSDLSYANLISPLGSDFSPDLTTHQIECGLAAAGEVGCAVFANGKWEATHAYWPSGGFTNVNDAKEADIAQTPDLERVVVAPGVPLMPNDHLSKGGLYEISKAETPSPKLTLINELSNGTELGIETTRPEAQIPLLGGFRSGSPEAGVYGTAYHAVSEDGKRIFFTAKPPGGVAHLQEIYERIEGNPGAEDISLSGSIAEKECLASCPGASSAIFQGASGNGEDVFFTTDGKLVSSDTNETEDLYEYEVATKNLVLLSEGTEAAEVQGVVRTSSDGSHVYFVAKGVLTPAAGPLGTTAQKGSDNLYVVDPHAGAGGTRSVRFIATLAEEDDPLWGGGGSECVPTYESCERKGARKAQVNGSAGESLVFSTYAHLDSEDHSGCGEAATVCTAQSVYLYQEKTQQLTWVSRPNLKHLAAPYNEGRGASLESTIHRSGEGAQADYEDLTREISANGEEIAFSSSERLDRGADGAGETYVYLWHCPKAGVTCTSAEHEVSLVSPGNASSAEPVMSASGNDIFFVTAAELVPQDEDQLEDVYDVQVGGEIGPPQAEASCFEEGCQGPLAALPEFAAPSSEIFSGGLNVPAPSAPAKASKQAAKAAVRRGVGHARSVSAGRVATHHRARARRP
jgi:hypothetical protein